MQKYSKSLRELGSASRVAKEQTENTAGSWTRLGSVAESVGITLGNVLLPSVTKVFEGLAKVGGVLESLNEKYPRLTNAVILGTTATVGLKVGMIALGYAFTFFKGGILAVIGAMIRLRSATVLAGGALTIFKGGLVAVTTRAIPALVTGLKVLRLAVVSNPIGAVAVGLATAATLIVANWTKVKAFFKSLWSDIKIGKIGRVFSVFGNDKKIITNESATDTLAKSLSKTKNQVQTQNQKVSNDFNFVVNTQPGQNAKEIAEEAYRLFEERMDLSRRSDLFDGAY